MKENEQKNYTVNRKYYQEQEIIFSYCFFQE